MLTTAVGLRARRLTLVELMVVVAIIAVLAAIAIPSFYTMQLKAKRSELYPNVSGAMDAMVAYDAAFDGWPALMGTTHPRPVAALDKVLVQWTTGSNFDTISWAPDGAVRGAYWIWNDGCGSCTPSPGEVAGFTDVDDDGSYYAYCMCVDDQGNMSSGDFPSINNY